MIGGQRRRRVGGRGGVGGGQAAWRVVDGELESAPICAVPYNKQVCESDGGERLKKWKGNLSAGDVPRARKRKHPDGAAGVTSPPPSLPTPAAAAGEKRTTQVVSRNASRLSPADDSLLSFGAAGDAARLASGLRGRQPA